MSMFKNCIWPFHPRSIFVKDLSFQKLRKIHGLKRFIYGLKCFQEDEFPQTLENTLGSPVYSCKFGKSEDTSSLLGLAYEDGRIVLQETAGPNEGKYLIDKEAHGNAIFDISWVPKKNELISAVADSILRLWSLEKDLTSIQDFRGHTKSVKSVDVNSWDTNVFASGGRDCNVIVWDTRCQPTHKANMIIGAHSSQKCLNSPGLNRSCASQMQNSVISVMFNEQHHLLSAGASDGLIKVWDLRKTYCKGKREPQSLHTLEFPGQSSYRGYTSMCLSPYGERVYISCLDGKIYAYHLTKASPKPVEEFFGHRPNTYYAKICLSPCGSYLLSGSSDDQAYVWLTQSAGAPIATLSGHSDEVTSVAWSSNNSGMLVTCSDDMKHRIFKYKLLERDDPESKQYLRGFATPYETDKNKSTGLTKDHSGISMMPRDNLNESRFHSKTSTTSHSENVPLPNFSLSKPADESSHSDLHVGPQHQFTPNQRRAGARTEQVTPKTSERKTLLTWLSSSKTPTHKASSSTSHTPKPHQSSFSNKNASKRKLTDLMDINQENLKNEDKRKVLFQSQNVLTERDNQLASPLHTNGVAKMLTYADAPEKEEYTKSEDMEDAGGFKLIDDVIDKNKYSDSSFSSNPIHVEIISPVRLLSSPPSVTKTKPHLSPMNNSLLSSPTANLPNYVIDGSSPHNRREPPLTRKRQADWLTSLTLKNKFAQGMKLISEGNANEVRVTRKRKSKNATPKSNKKMKA